MPYAKAYCPHPLKGSFAVSIKINYSLRLQKERANHATIIVGKFDHNDSPQTPLQGMGAHLCIAITPQYVK